MNRPLRTVLLATTVLCVFLALSCSDDPTAPTASSPTFIVRLDLSGFDRFDDVTGLDDGTILAGGTTRTMRIDTAPTPPDTTHDEDACVIRFEASGDTMWTSVYGQPNHSEFVTAVTRSAADGYATAGSRAPYAPTSDAFVERVLETGETGWSVEIDLNGFDVPEQIITTSDGSYVMAGQASDMGGRSAASVVRISQGGTVEWAHAFSYGDTNLLGISVEELPDDGLLVVADAYIRNETYDELWILELSPTGELLGSLRFPWLENMYVIAATPLTDGGYRLVGQHAEQPGAGVFHMTANAQGAMTSARLTYIEANFAFYDGRSTDDGGAILCGKADGDGMFIKLDAEGEIAWERRFPIEGGEVSLFAVDEHLEGYVAAGEFIEDGSTNRDMVLIRTDGNGEVD